MKNLNKIVEIKFGSFLYGTNTPESDLDLRGVFLPTREEILLGDYKDTVDIKTKVGSGKNTKDDIDRQFFSVKKFLHLLKRGDTGAYDMLFAPKESRIYETQEWGKILSYRDKLLQCGLEGMVGYIYHQTAKYGLKGSNIDALEQVIAVLEKLPPRDKGYLHWDKIKEELSKIEQVTWLLLPINDKQYEEIPAFEILKRKFPSTNHNLENLRVARKIRESYGKRAEMARTNLGVDYKAVQHAYRVLGQVEELLTTGHITFPRPDAEKLLKIRKAEIPYSEISAEIERRIEELKELKEKSTLPDKLDEKFIDSIVMEMHGEICLKN